SLGEKSYNIDYIGRYTSLDLGDCEFSRGLEKTERSNIAVKENVRNAPPKLRVNIDASYGNVNLDY
ncbi:MAG: hypothetical protein ACK5MI_06265, partial [Mangrovibacterium sp.]